MGFAGPSDHHRESAPPGAVPATAGAMSEAVPLFFIAEQAMFEWEKVAIPLIFPAGRRRPYFFRHRGLCSFLSDQKGTGMAGRRGPYFFRHRKK